LFHHSRENGNRFTAKLVIQLFSCPGLTPEAEVDPSLRGDDDPLVRTLRVR
jgi:hypothetical protein